MPTTIESEAAAWQRPLSDIRAAHLILTLRCNYRCGFCFQPNFHDDLPEEVWRTRLAGLYPQLREVVLHGGEPTVGSRFRDFCSVFSEFNRAGSLSIFTNGFRFDAWWAELMLARGGFVNFSINAASPGTYLLVNGQNNYAQVADNIRSFRQEVDRHRSSVKLDVSFVITPANASEILDFLALADDLAADRVRYFFDLDNLPQPTTELRTMLDRAQLLAQQHPARVVWGLEVFGSRVFGHPVGDQFLESTGCTRTFDNIYIGVNGDVSFCNFLHGQSIGNLGRQTLEEVWNSPAALAQRSAQAHKQWDYCLSAYCGPTSELRTRPKTEVFIPTTSLTRRRPE